MSTKTQNRDCWVRIGIEVSKLATLVEWILDLGSWIFPFSRSPSDVRQMIMGARDQDHGDSTESVATQARKLLLRFLQWWGTCYMGWIYFYGFPITGHIFTYSHINCIEYMRQQEFFVVVVVVFVKCASTSPFVRGHSFNHCFDDNRKWWPKRQKRHQSK